MPAIQVTRLSKHFRRHRRREGLSGSIQDLFHRRWDTIHAVEEISFSIEPGERVGYIGPNGAGKSTSIKMLTGILTPSGGRIDALGMSPHRDRREYARHIGVVFGQRTQLWWDLAVIESYRLLGRMYRVEAGAYRERLGRLREILALDEFLHTPVRKLSLGQRMRADLAASLLHRPALLFLDEPTIGLDLVAKDAIRGFLRDVNREFGTTILLTTHDLRDIEALTERVMVIDRGRLVFDGPLDDLRDAAIDEGIARFDFTEEPRLEDLEGIDDSVTWKRLSPVRFEARFPRSRLKVADLLGRCVRRFSVADVALPEPSIEEVIRRIYSSPPPWTSGG
jgi:ABC-2 type transport system ATP-binding protein